jgi:hypothetical protein
VTDTALNYVTTLILLAFHLIFFGYILGAVVTNYSWDVACRDGGQIWRHGDKVVYECHRINLSDHPGKEMR